MVKCLSSESKKRALCLHQNHLNLIKEVPVVIKEPPVFIKVMPVSIKAPPAFIKVTPVSIKAPPALI